MLVDVNTGFVFSPVGETLVGSFHIAIMRSYNDTPKTTSSPGE